MEAILLEGSKIELNKDKTGPRIVSNMIHDIYDRYLLCFRLMKGHLQTRYNIG